MPASTYPYTNWPSPDDVLARLKAAGVTLRTGFPLDRLRQIGAAVTQQVFHETRRQFVADTEDVTRIYDGSGTGEQEVDEMVSLTGVAVVGFSVMPGYPMADASLISESTKPKTRIVTAKGSAPAWQTSAVLSPQYYSFPAGRQNIAVTGKFGYGASIPADLWEAVCGEIAVRATREALFTSGGRVVEEQFGDERRKYALPDAEATGWAGAFTQALKDYKRPQGKRLRRMRPEML